MRRHHQQSTVSPAHIVQLLLGQVQAELFELALVFLCAAGCDRRGRRASRCGQRVRDGSKWHAGVQGAGSRRLGRGRSRGVSGAGSRRLGRGRSRGALGQSVRLWTRARTQTDANSDELGGASATGGNWSNAKVSLGLLHGFLCNKVFIGDEIESPCVRKSLCVEN
eukprot:363932-Chlamydomonas_euryale.AAC.6